jgi:ABC-2 type transport system permease protein
MTLSGQVPAILWAQWRALRNLRPAEGRGGRVLALAMGVIWYGMWAGLAVAIGLIASSAGMARLHAGLPWGLMAVFLYWQLAPLLTGSAGMSIDVRKLLLYPVPARRLFLMELLLRAVAGLEMLLVLGGATAGLLRNPAVPSWGPLLAMPPFIALNLFAAAGMRSLIERILAYRRVREALVLLVLLAAVIPQAIAYLGVPEGLGRYFGWGPAFVWPWAAAARIALADRALPFLALLFGWVALAWVFGTRQFQRSLSFDLAAAAAAGRREGGANWFDALYRLPGLFLSDPVAALVEKELRSLARAPRFRVLFLMGFSFGVLIWLPMFRERAAHAEAGGNYPVLISLYAVVLLGEVLIWNVFGFDRAAAQLYYSAPVPFAKVLAGKNLAGTILIVLEIALVLLVCTALRLPVSAPKVLEAYVVTLVLCTYLLGAGNLASLYYPRPMNPDNAWGRSSGGKLVLFLLLSLPLLSVPVALAYAARYAFDSEAAFFAVLAAAGGAGIVFYSVSLDSAVLMSERRKETILAALGESAGPIVSE